jgi:nucleotide-binding universal stress UspA family protein
MKSILVPVEEHLFIHPVMETALLLGRAFDSHIEGLAITAVPEFVVADMALGGASFLDPNVRQERAEASRRHFHAFMSAQDIAPATAEAKDGLCFGWREGELADDAYVGRYGRIFDITVLGRPSEAPDHPRFSTTESALFDSGRPVLVAPPAALPTLGQTIAIAWNRSTETARAVALAMPLLAKARRIVLIEIDGWGVPGPSGQDLARTLARHGLAVETRTVPDRQGRPGEVILTTAASLGCDLLIKGAYTQSRLRQMIFGGATRHILGQTTLPVLMAH